MTLSGLSCWPDTLTIIVSRGVVIEESLVITGRSLRPVKCICIILSLSKTTQIGSLKVPEVVCLLPWVKRSVNDAEDLQRVSNAPYNSCVVDSPPNFSRLPQNGESRVSLSQLQPSSYHLGLHGGRV
ncbi:hypothetical protein E2C01_024191 [Portunus trituberculatus]|uniref:Uncharacterized protein n=1 Tax=Portunus trituberculatus TaxID=210409 RepID=A0A5B7EBF0_PORTR|nr:hypothetical protein [Portunus trituberculatus]